MNILVVGSGAREHTIVWKCIQSELVDRVYCAPGNAGIGMIAQCVDIPTDDVDSLLEFVLEKHIDLTIVGPEKPLVDGIVDRFQSKGLSILGPSKQAALIEGSKIFAKNLMMTYGIATASFRIFVFPDLAKSYIRKQKPPFVIKANGLASGKGVVVANTIEEADKAIDSLMAKDYGRLILIEDFLDGWECSFIVLTDGKDIVPFPVSQDYKGLYKGGPNTGGMGAYSPVPAVTQELYDEILSTIINPMVSCMAKNNMPYRGFLYAGLMITQDGPKVVEFNCRLGDPEAQAILPPLESDFIELCLAAAGGKLRNIQTQWSSDAFVDVVLASPGYPDKPRAGYRIYGLEEAVKEGALVFHAGTREKTRINPRENPRENFVTDGGRVLSVVGRGKDHEAAREMAYRAASYISFGNRDPIKGKQYYRKDIALDI